MDDGVLPSFVLRLSSSLNNPAAQNYIVVVKHRALPRRHVARRFFKRHARAGIVERSHPARAFGSFVTNLRRALEWLCGRTARHPIDLPDAHSILSEFRFDADRALDEVDAEYSTTTELADVLQRDADVPFRAGHHFASELVTYGRANRLRPADIPFTEARRLYADAVAAFGLPTALPLTEPVFRETLSARGMVRASQGMGGPQPAEVARMLAGQRVRLAADQSWVADMRENQARAGRRRDAAFDALRGAGG